MYLYMYLIFVSYHKIFAFNYSYSTYLHIFKNKNVAKYLLNYTLISDMIGPKLWRLCSYNKIK